MVQAALTKINAAEEDVSQSGFVCGNNQGFGSASERGSSIRVSTLKLLLRFVLACLTAIATIVLPVFTEPRVVVSLAERAVAIARTALFGLIADQASKFLVGHGEASLSPTSGGQSLLGSILGHREREIKFGGALTRGSFSMVCSAP